MNKEPRFSCAEFIRTENFDQQLLDMGVTPEVILNSINHCYKILKIIDDNLNLNNTPNLANLVELANLSSIIGNLVGEGFAKYSNDLFIRNKPHAYPDLLSTDVSKEGIEIKMALESNSPKGHLAKEGFYLTYRYVLTNSEEKYVKGKANRGDTVTIWEVKFDFLEENDFKISNTEGDSGKTATIPKPIHNKMKLLYFNPNCVPYKHSIKSPYVGYN